MCNAVLGGWFAFGEEEAQLAAEAGTCRRKRLGMARAGMVDQTGDVGEAVDDTRDEDSEGGSSIDGQIDADISVTFEVGSCHSTCEPNEVIGGEEMFICERVMGMVSQLVDLKQDIGGQNLVCKGFGVVVVKARHGDKTDSAEKEQDAREDERGVDESRPFRNGQVIPFPSG